MKSVVLLKQHFDFFTKCQYVCRSYCINGYCYYYYYSYRNIKNNFKLFSLKLYNSFFFFIYDLLYSDKWNCIFHFIALKINQLKFSIFEVVYIILPLA